MWTRNNSTNIDWASYEFDGWCPDCDFCRDCGHGHLVGTSHKCPADDGLVSFDTVFHICTPKDEGVWGVSAEGSSYRTATCKECGKQWADIIISTASAEIMERFIKSRS